MCCKNRHSNTCGACGNAVICPMSAFIDRPSQKQEEAQPKPYHTRMLLYILRTQQPQIIEGLCSNGVTTNRTSVLQWDQLCSSNFAVPLRRNRTVQEIEMQFCSGHQCTHTGAEYVLNDFVCVLQAIYPLFRHPLGPTVTDTPWSQ